MASIKLKGDTSGEVTISAPAVAGTTTLELPATSSTLATQNALGVRNLIINGDMKIAQRGTSVTGITGSNYYTCDRWRFLAANVGTWTQTQSTDVPTGQGFANSLKMECTTASALSAGSNGSIITRLEGQHLQHLKKGTASAESLTLSFWVKSNKTGTLTASLFDGDNTRWISKSYTIDTADTWEQKTLTFAGDITGAFDNDNGSSLHIYMWLMAGTDYTSGTLATSWESYTTANTVDSSQINLADSTSNYINITGVQLEVGDTATPFEHRPYDMELLRCKRYFERFDGISVPSQTISVVDVSNRPETYINYYKKRANPTITGSTDPTIGTMANSFLTATNGPFTYVGTYTDSALLFYSVSSGVSANSLSGINFVYLPSGKYINIDAEL